MEKGEYLMNQYIDKSKKVLTEKQKEFCHEYMIDFNATQAAIRAGYSEKTARSIAAENLTKPYLQAYLAGMIQKQAKKTEISVEWIIQELKQLYDRCQSSLTSPGAIAGATKQLELLGKHLAMFTDKFKVVNDDLHITVIMVDVKEVIIQVQQVITHHVSDPKVRDRIARELEGIESYKGRRKEDN